ncbi:MAG: UDP-N-acetylglucosamine 1-carboxyvinyltransferase [Candidatus Aureabacteria bacterium]|nr:UDP-N-acetylglucosamine 1-carboxyvinyltransferase [Candidatus Auribacterota bacterium]
MDVFKIQGGVPLKGEVTVSGSKNAVLPLMCAALMGDSPSIIRNVPRLRDVFSMIEILNSLGAEAEFIEDSVLRIDPYSVNKYEAPYEQVKKMRASICVLGPLFGKFGEARVSMPGGCVIGPRPVDIHLKGLKALGAEITIEHGYIVAKGKPVGGEIFLGGRFGSSVTATANILMAAVLAKGRTIIESAAMEPELGDLAQFLNRMGAKITGLHSHVLQIEGVSRLHGIEYSVIADRIEAGTFMLSAAITQGDVFVRNAQVRHLRALMDKLILSGIQVNEEKDGIRVVSELRPKSAEIITFSFPGFPTDLQAQMMALMSVADGISVITEKIYPERFMHISELNRMGAEISLEGSTAVIKGVSTLSGAPVMASDLRASAGLVLGALVAKGESLIYRVYHIDRGYEQIEKKLSDLGAVIIREKEEEPSV